MTPSDISQKVQPRRLKTCFFSLLIFGTFTWVCSQPSLSADAFEKDWTSHIDRTWIGPEFWANRLQDWEIKNGFVQCIESSKKAPLRTLSLITGSTILKGDSLKLAVEIHLEKPSKASQALAGFLIGSGGSHVDYRLSALTHHRPAEDGGMLAVVNMEGRVFLFDHSKPIGKDNLWSISGSIAASDLPMIAQGNQPDVDTDVAVWNKLTLTLNIQKTEHGLRTDLESRNSGTGLLISRLTLWSTPEAFTDGGVALVSHLSPDSSDKGFAFNRWTIEGDRFDHDYDRHFGPILTTQYTLSRNVLSLTAQAGPLSAADPQRAALEVYDENQSQWRPIAYSELKPMSYTFPFRIENWDDTRDTPYRIVYDLKTSATDSERTFFEGTIRKNPTEKEELVVTAFTGHKIFTGGLKWNHHGVWFPHNDILDAVQHHDPDFLFFSGDQIYEGDMTAAVYEPLNKAMLDTSINGIDGAGPLKILRAIVPQSPFQMTMTSITVTSGAPAEKRHRQREAIMTGRIVADIECLPVLSIVSTALRFLTCHRVPTRQASFRESPLITVESNTEASALLSSQIACSNHHLRLHYPKQNSTMDGRRTRHSIRPLKVM